MLFIYDRVNGNLRSLCLFQRISVMEVNTILKDGQRDVSLKGGSFKFGISGTWTKLL